MAVLAIAAVGAVAGGVVGAGFGAVALGASIGWAVGSFIGQLAFGPDPPSQQGPRLTDLNVQSSAEGVGIPIVFGRARIAGNVIWGQPIQETRHEEEVGGKGMFGGGGGSQVSYTYSVSFALGICEGPIIGVRKIWADSKLIYDVSTGANAGTLQVSQERAKAIRVYTPRPRRQTLPSRASRGRRIPRPIGAWLIWYSRICSSRTSPTTCRMSPAKC